MIITISYWFLRGFVWPLKVTSKNVNKTYNAQQTDAADADAMLVSIELKLKQSVHYYYLSNNGSSFGGMQ